MYLVKEKILEQLNIDNSTFELYRTLKMLRYSSRTNKYDINSILQVRTLTLGIENLITEEQKEQVLQKMKEFSSFKHKITKEKLNGKSFSNSGKDRLHRKIGKDYNLTSLETDSGLKYVEGTIKSVTSWYEKSIKNLEDKILKIQEKLEQDLINNKKKEKKNYHRNYFKGKKKKLDYLKNKLVKLQSDNRLSIHYGKSIYIKIKNQKDILFKETNLKNRKQIIHNLSRLKEEYRKKRLEYFVEGSVKIGNKKIVIEKSQESKSGYQIRFIFSTKKSEQIILQINKFPSSHNTFNLETYNKQSNRISFNSKGKLVLYCTYSYIKPFNLEVELGKNSKGTCGIDIGPNEITCVFIKNDGNPYKKFSYDVSTLLDKRNKDTIRNISEILENITKKCIEEGFYSISIEKLTFDNNKYKYISKNKNRLLMKFPFEMFASLIKSKTTRKGLKRKEVNLTM